MPSVDLTKLELKKIITHHLGNKLRDEQYSLSNDLTIVNDESKEFLLKHFLNPLKYDEIYSFHHPVDLSRNDIYNTSKEVFKDQDGFVKYSQQIAKLLYEHSTHPRIKEGELNIVLFSGAEFESKRYNALGIFKSESTVPFIKMNGVDNLFRIDHELGFEIGGMDKGCLILQSYEDFGYRVLIGDKISPSYDAQYWKDDFLKVSPISDEYYNTNQFLSLARDFVKKGVNDNLRFTKVDKIDLLNKSVEYFKAHETFDKNEFENEVLRDTQLIKSFNEFDSSYQNHGYNIQNFKISSVAVRKQSRSIKSVIKLDENFHIYVHGDREMIEQGVERDGRRYYKIYFEKED